MSDEATQVYRVFIRSSAEAIWDAVTLPEWTSRYGYGSLANYELRPGGRYYVEPNPAFRARMLEDGHAMEGVIAEGQVLEADAPHRLVTTFRMPLTYVGEEGETRVTHEIIDLGTGVCLLRLTHEFDGAPEIAAVVGGSKDAPNAGGGHAWVLCDLKSLLETGAVMAT